MRNRVEDLGRIYEKLHEVIRHHLFDHRSIRNKDFADEFLK